MTGYWTLHGKQALQQAILISPRGWQTGQGGQGRLELDGTWKTRGFASATVWLQWQMVVSSTRNKVKPVIVSQ